jgi:hypothetical protein
MKALTRRRVVAEHVYKVGELSLKCPIGDR